MRIVPFKANYCDLGSIVTLDYVINIFRAFWFEMNKFTRTESAIMFLVYHG